jgi:hypothetical protein
MMQIDLVKALEDRIDKLLSIKKWKYY